MEDAELTFQMTRRGQRVTVHVSDRAAAQLQERFDLDPATVFTDREFGVQALRLRVVSGRFASVVTYMHQIGGCEDGKRGVRIVAHVDEGWRPDRWRVLSVRRLKWQDAPGMNLEEGIRQRRRWWAAQQRRIDGQQGQRGLLLLALERRLKEIDNVQAAAWAQAVRDPVWDGKRHPVHWAAVWDRVAGQTAKIASVRQQIAELDERLERALQPPGWA